MWSGTLDSSDVLLSYHVITHTITHNHHTNIISPDLEHGEIHEPKLLEKVESDVVCAFVTFQYCESMARCVEDYKRYR